MKFNSEYEMGLVFKEFVLPYIQNNLEIELIEEFRSPFGIPDFMLVERDNCLVKNVISFELKLNNWQRALIQAFKYKSFSHQSFVIMDYKKERLMEKHVGKFEKSNIGLALFNDKKELKILNYPMIDNPYSTHIVNTVLKKIQQLLLFKLDKNNLTILHHKKQLRKAKYLQCLLNTQ